MKRTKKFHFNHTKNPALTGGVSFTKMKERPINMKAWEIRCVLAGRKTQFRRVVKPQPENGATLGSLIPQPAAKGSCAHFHHIDKRGIHSKELTVHCPYGATGDRLWVRECHYVSLPPYRDNEGAVEYRADYCDELAREIPWKSSTHMPRWASRITLEVVSVRVERLQDISGYDAIAEGIEPFRIDLGGAILTTFRDYLNAKIDRSAHQSYRTLWQSINGPGSWEANPWVWVVEFRQV